MNRKPDHLGMLYGINTHLDYKKEKHHAIEHS